MPNEYKPLKNYERHNENPYLFDMEESIQIKRKREMIYPTNSEVVHYVVNSATGENDGYSAFMRISEVDEQQFVKIFTRELRTLWDLSKVAGRIFTYVVQCMRMNRDTIYFDVEECMEYTGYKSRRSIINGMSELIEHGVIARSTKTSIYFINPAVVFNGNRVTFAKTYIKKRRGQRDDQTIDMFERQKQLEALQEGIGDEQHTGKADTTE